ncbi:hypothetical protein EA472_08255 [Natrarchaeobius oligotrophus]|uniref:Uncharacterized protein n=1 Tax=Natrarchaeobius chitinivorans TaxID=1679083 RepID=A0A3N6MC24_NATCH|nr:hypothetical protein EA472_08255 [Natrarchaeobius chitinivorans]
MDRVGDRHPPLTVAVAVGFSPPVGFGARSFGVSFDCFNNGVSYDRSTIALKLNSERPYDEADASTHVDRF